MIDYRKIKYLDPKNDLTFRKIFGQHPAIMKSFLNSLLPLPKGRYIEHLFYQDPAMFPEIPELKHTIVDVKCTDNYGRHFIVEMQMYWTNSFKSRMLFNSGKAYVKQLDRGNKYSELHPVYGLSLVNDIYLSDEKYADKYYHHYRLAHQDIPDEAIEGIELIFIELPKFKAKSFTEKRMQNLWLRFLTEVDENTLSAPEDLIKSKEIKDALEHLQVSAFNLKELRYYDDYWDKIRLERIAIDDAIEKKKRAEAQAQEAQAQAQKAQIQAQKAEAHAQEAKKKLEKAENKQYETERKLEEFEKRKHETESKLEKAIFKLNKLGLPIKEIAETFSLNQKQIEMIISKYNQNL